MRTRAEPDPSVVQPRDCQPEGGAVVGDGDGDGEVELDELDVVLVDEEELELAVVADGDAAEVDPGPI